MVKKSKTTDLQPDLHFLDAHSQHRFHRPEVCEDHFVHRFHHLEKLAGHSGHRFLPLDCSHKTEEREVMEVSKG